MEYISAEEFLKQDEKVQRTLKEYFDQEIILYSFNNSVNYGVFDDVIDETPLLTEGQLRRYIEDKTRCRMSTVFYTLTGYDIVIYNEDKIINTYLHLGDNLLRAYWEIACDISRRATK